jgi:TPR repeat protein
VADRLLKGQGPYQRNTTKAAQLYALAAEQGDVQSLMNLGWILQAGDAPEDAKYLPLPLPPLPLPPLPQQSQQQKAIGAASKGETVSTRNGR